MAFENLQIAGIGLPLKSKFPLKLVTRKIYNPKYFFDESYQHEIANHYRDFKLRPRLRRRRRRHVYVRLCKRACNNDEGYSDLRKVFTPPLHYFPRFTDVYKPRGRQTLCELKPPDETYNDAVRRIKAAENSETLRQLYQRQLKSQQQNANKSNKQTANTTTRTIATNATTAASLKCKHTKDTLYDDYKKQQQQQQAEHTKIAQTSTHKRQQQQQKQQRRGQRRRSLGNLAAVLSRDQSCEPLPPPQQQWQSLNETSTNTNTNSKADNSENNALNSSDEHWPHYIQLAAEYYEKGYLRNIRYLVSIGEHNATKALQDLTTKKDFGEHNEIPSRRATLSVDNAIKDCQKLQVRKLTKLLRKIGRKRSFRIGTGPASNDDDDDDHEDGISISEESDNDWAISVNIKPTQQQSNTVSSPGLTKAVRRRASCSMNDYLNATTSEAFNFAITNTKFTTSATNFQESEHKAATSRHFHELIGNLSQLELNDANNPLPKITLTDCSTLTTNTQTTASEVPTNNKTSDGAPSNRFKLHQTKFSVNNSSLDIPIENNFYSDARPP